MSTKQDVPSASETVPKGRLEGKTCVITGAAQGIGRATLEAFVKEGATVIAVDINKEKLEELDDVPGVETYLLDVRDGDELRKLASTRLDVEVLFNCAGIVHKGFFLNTTEEDWDKSFDVNVKSMYHTCQAFLPQMLQRRKGTIINMSSVASSIRGVEQRSLYGATKAAVIGLTKGIAIDYIRQGIRCNVVCPAPVATVSFQDRASDDADSDKDHEIYMREKLMGRLGKPEEVANLCVYLASDESSFHTGNVFTMDGGFCL